MARASALEVLRLQQAEKTLDERIFDEVVQETMPGEFRDKIRQTLLDYSHTWRQTKLGECKILTHRLETGGAPPIAHKPRRLAIIEDLVRAVGGSSWFSTIDMKSGFHQILIDEEIVLDAFASNGPDKVAAVGRQTLLLEVKH